MENAKQNAMQNIMQNAMQNSMQNAIQNAMQSAYYYINEKNPIKKHMLFPKNKTQKYKTQNS